MNSAPTPPPWMALALRADRGVAALFRLEQRVLTDLICRLVPPASRDDVTAWCYAQMAAYRPGGVIHQSGLSDWERRVVDGPLFPRTGRVLLGGAGGGREVVALAERGLRVRAFDPSDLVERVQPPAGAELCRASYADLVAAVAGRGGVLGPWVDEGPYDAVVLGWTSLSHVTEAADRVALLRAVKRVAPRGPVLASFLMVPEGAGTAAAGMWRTVADRVVGPRPPQLSFHTQAGFVHSFVPGEVEQLAATAGFRTVVSERWPYPHAVFVAD